MLNNLIKNFNFVLTYSCILALSALVTITVIDVAGRYLFNFPLAGASEITEILLAIIIFIGLPYITKEEGHVTVSIFTQKLSLIHSKIHSIIINTLIFILLIFISKNLLYHGLNLYSYNEITTYLEIPKAPIAFLMAFLTLLAAFSALFNSYNYIIKKVKTSENK